MPRSAPIVAIVLVSLLGCDRRARTCPACPEAPATPTTILHGEAASGSTELPTSDQVAAAMSQAAERVRRCGPFTGTRYALVTVAFAATGAAVEAKAFPPLAGTAQGACIQDAVRAVNLALPARRPLELTWAYDLAPPEAPAPPEPAHQPARGPVRCGQIDPATGLIRVCFDRE